MTPTAGWPSGRSHDGGLDRITTPDGVGELWLCGKHVVAPDPEALCRRIGSGTTIVSLNQSGDIARYPGYESWLRSSPDALWFPIPDFHAPGLVDALPMLEQIVGRLRESGPVVMHCSAGIGRAGTMAVAVLMMLGLGRREAVERVAAERPGAGPEVGAQNDLIVRLDAHLATN